MQGMQTRSDNLAPDLNWLDPFGGWQAAARWNAMAAEWMASGWKQWLELATLWPAISVVPAQAVIPALAGTEKARDARTPPAQALDSRQRGNDGGATRASRPAAKAASKRPAARRPARPQAAGRSNRSRG